MKMLLWKELRENIRWAALGLLALLFADIYALSLGGTGITLCSSTFLLVSAFGCSAAGALLGALQILPELRRDQWASLLHRPLPRPAILLAKAVAGLLLYLAMTGLALLASAIYAAWPGRFAAPFVPSLALPGLSDILLGVAIYFAALLLSLTQGRWAGARGAIVLGTVGIFLDHLDGVRAFSLPTVAALVLFAAAWGALLGSVAVRPWITRLALGIAILTGLQTGLIFIGSTLQVLARSPDYPSNGSFYIAPDGSVFIEKEDGKGGAILIDDGGKVVTDPRYARNDSAGQPLYPHSFGNRDGIQVPEFYRANLRLSWNHLKPMSLGFQSPENWYLFPAPQSYFVGYDRRSARRIGICDAEGFKGPLAVPHPFSGEIQGYNYGVPILIWAGTQVFSVDFAQRKLTRLLDAPGDSIYGVTALPNGSSTRRIVVALGFRVRILDSEGAPLLSIPYGHDGTRWPRLSVAATQDSSRLFFEYDASYYGPASRDPAPGPVLDVLDGEGRLIHTYTHEPPGRVAPTVTARLAQLLVNLPAPSLIATLAGYTHPAARLYRAPFLEISGDLEKRDLMALFAWAALCAAVALGWGWCAGLSPKRTGLWAALTLAFGPAGLLAYRLSTDWPIGVRCPRCAHRRPVREESCPHCQAAWAAPEPNGTEIFEAA